MATSVVAANLTPSRFTPTKQRPSEAIPSVIESPGVWKHPRLKEINRRRARRNFDGSNVWSIALNGLSLIAYTILCSFFPSLGITRLIQSLNKSTGGWATLALYIPFLFPVINIFFALLPLVLPSDDLSDIALTPQQRQILGLPPASRPASPGSVISTPPRYSRTPSRSGSPASWASSPLSRNNSPRRSSYSPSAQFSNTTMTNPATASPLLYKAVNKGCNHRRSSFGSPSPLGVSTGSSLFGDSSMSSGPSTPTLAPAKRASVGLTNKWLYQKQRRSPSTKAEWLSAQ